MEATIYNQSGKAAGKLALPESVFGAKWNGDLVHQVVTAMEANARTMVAHAKDRSEVSGGGKKPWKQKGTGRARHGSTRSPIWRKGGKAHGPRNDKDYSQKLNRKMKAKALYTVLAKKHKDGQVLFVDKLMFDSFSAKTAKEILGTLATVQGFDALATRRKNAAIFTTFTPDAKVRKSFANFGNVEVAGVRRLNPVDVLKYKFVIIVEPAESIAFIESKLAKAE